ncbi:MAG TPA: hypothetical protein VN604_04565 [Nitrospirota bacterium]|nr:hypothetical protein [Nitrospirota bacterium]
MNDLNDSRRERFCRFQKEVRGSAEYLIVGLDIAKERQGSLGDVVVI